MATSEAPLDAGDENGNPWTPLKDLAAVVDAAVLRHQPGLQVRILSLSNVKLISAYSPLLVLPIHCEGI